MKILKSVWFYSVLAGVLTVIALFPFNSWQSIVGCISALIMLTIVPALSSYWNYVEKNKQQWTLGRKAPGIIRYYQDQIKFASERRHPKCTDCQKRLKRSQMIWLHVPLWVPVRKEYDQVLGWRCAHCLERRLFEMANQVHLANENNQVRQ